MKRKELEIWARECLTIAAWCVHRLPINEWVDWPVLLVNLLACQSDITNDVIEDTLVRLNERITTRLAKGQW